MNNGFDRFELLFEQTIGIVLELAPYIAVMIGFLLFLQLLKSRFDGFSSEYLDDYDDEFSGIVDVAEGIIRRHKAETKQDRS